LPDLSTSAFNCAGELPLTIEVLISSKEITMENHAQEPQSTLGRAIKTWQAGRNISFWQARELIEQGYDVPALAQAHRPKQ
jgi:hypothetical protein